MKVEALVYSGAFDKFGERNELIKIYNTKININKKFENIKLSENELIEKEVDILNLCLSKSIISEEFDQYIKGDRRKLKTPSYVSDHESEYCNLAGVLKKISTRKFKSGKKIGKEYKQIEVCDDFNSVTINLFNIVDSDYIISVDVLNKNVVLLSLKRFVNGTYTCGNNLKKSLQIL